MTYRNDLIGLGEENDFLTLAANDSIALSGYPGSPKLSEQAHQGRTTKRGRPLMFPHSIRKYQAMPKCFTKMLIHLGFYSDENWCT